MQLRSEDNLYWFRCDYTDRDVAKQAGLKWNRARACFFTPDVKKAATLKKYADSSTLAKVEEELKALEQSISKSKALSSSLPIPTPGPELYDFQKAGVEFALARPRTLIADDMGVGKTIQAIGFINMVQPRSVLIICPASVKLNWVRELEKWVYDFPTIGVSYGNKPFPEDNNIVIINYDILSKFHDQIHSKEWDVLIIDESQYLKNPGAKRTVEAYGGKGRAGIKAKRVLALTGTPIVNRPVELFPTLNYLDPKTFPSFFKFAMRYCGAFQSGWGWDFTGATNLEELQTLLRTTVMIRRLKRDVLPELPGKTRQIIELPTSGLTRVIKTEMKAVKIYKKQVQDLSMTSFSAFTELAELRYETALAKVPAVINYLKDIIESGQKVVCFAWHKDVINKIREAFIEHPYNYHSCITGDTPVKKRQAVVDEFQNNKHCTLFVGNILAAGVGITLTAASQVVFAELDWVPGNMSQAEDRCDRIGQDSCVNVKHLVLEGSIDAYIAKMLVNKQEVIDQALDKKEVDSEPDLDLLQNLFNNY